jgi:hypothetical protein
MKSKNQSLTTAESRTSASTQRSKLGTNVPSTALIPADQLVKRFNVLNATIVHGLPEMARAYVTLHSHLPLLQEMQALLSQRPKHAMGDRNFTLLHNLAGKTVRMATPIGSREELPTWSAWLSAYARAIDYSVRHIRRLVLGREPMKTQKECGWSATDHNRLITAATAGYDLVAAIEAGADTAALCQEIKDIMGSISKDVFNHEYQPLRKRVPKRPAQRVTHDAQEERRGP